MTTTNRFTLIFTLLISILIIQSCQKEDLEDISNIEAKKSTYVDGLKDESLGGDYKVINGILHFKDLGTYLKVKDTLSSKSIQERLDFSKNLGFKSQFLLIEEAFKDIESSMLKDGFEEKLEKYKDFVSYENNILKRKIVDGAASALWNKDGIVFIGKIPYRFTENNQYIAFNGDINMLKVAELSNSSPELGVYSTVNQPQTNKAARECTSMFNTYTTSDRRGELASNIVRVNRYWNGTAYTVEVHTYTVGTAYKQTCFFGCSWGTYSTENTLNVGYTVRLRAGAHPQSAIIKSEQVIYSYTNNYDYIDYNSYVYAYDVDANTVNNNLLNVWIDDATINRPIPLTSIRTQYTHRGLGGYWINAVCP